MKSLNQNKIASILGFITLLLLVFFRENLLLEINALLEGKENDRSYAFWFFDFFKEFSDSKLTQWKWVISLSFTICIACLTIFSLHYWFKNIKYTKLILLLYLIIAGLIFIVSLIAYFIDNFNEVYPLLRRVLGMIHSPIPFFIFFLLFLGKKDNL